MRRHPRTITRWVRAGKLSGTYDHTTGLTLVYATELLGWLRAGEAASRQSPARVEASPAPRSSDPRDLSDEEWHARFRRLSRTAGAPVGALRSPGSTDAVLAFRRAMSSDDLLLGLSRNPFDEDDLRNWRRRWFDPAAETVGIDATPKSLRHVFASVSAAAWINDVFTAAEMGHSLTVHREKYVKPLTRYAAAPFSGTDGAERMIYQARERAMHRVGVSLERKGSLAGLAADLRDELERDRRGATA